LFTGLSAYLLSRKKKCPFCFEVRDIWPQALIDLGVLSKKSPVTWLFRKIEIFLYRHADQVIAVLPFAYKHICQYGIPTERVAWIPNGVNLKRFADCKRYSGGTTDKLVVIYVGRFAAGHGIDAILKAAKILQNDAISKVKFIFVGNGPNKPCYDKMIHDYNLENVELRKAVPKKRLHMFLKKETFLSLVLRIFLYIDLELT